MRHSNLLNFIITLMIPVIIGMGIIVWKEIYEDMSLISPKFNQNNSTIYVSEHSDVSDHLILADFCTSILKPESVKSIRFRTDAKKCNDPEVNFFRLTSDNFVLVTRNHKEVICHSDLENTWKCNQDFSNDFSLNGFNSMNNLKLECSSSNLRSCFVTAEYGKGTLFSGFILAIAVIMVIQYILVLFWFYDDLRLYNLSHSQNFVMMQAIVTLSTGIVLLGSKSLPGFAFLIVFMNLLDFIIVREYVKNVCSF